MFSAILEKVERLERENAELRQSLNDLSRRLTTIESNKIICDDFTFSQKLNEMIDDKINDELNSESFSEYLNEAIDERVFDNETFTDCLNKAIDERLGVEPNTETFTEFLNEAISTAIMKNAVDQPPVSHYNKPDQIGIIDNNTLYQRFDDVVYVGVDNGNIPQFVSKNVVNDIISNRIGNFREDEFQYRFVEWYLIRHARVFYLECLIQFKDVIKQFDLMNIRPEHKFFYKGYFFGIKIINGKKTIGERSRMQVDGTPEQTNPFFEQAFGKRNRMQVLSYCLDAGTPEQTKLFFQAFEEVGIKLLYNGKPVIM